MDAWNVCKPLLETPHTLIAGTTGSGKSVLLNSTLYSAIPSGCGFYFIDLKRVELAKYRTMQSCIEYITEPSMVVPCLDRVLKEMDDRYKRMKGYKTDEQHIYVVVDELADLVTDKRVLERLVKIGRLGRAAGIHLLCATQDPSRRTLKAELMQNFTCTVALRCRSSIESRQIIGIKGAEDLPKYGLAYRWDADGVKMFEVPMTNDLELEERIKPKEPEKRSMPPWVFELTLKCLLAFGLCYLAARFIAFWL